PKQPKPDCFEAPAVLKRVYKIDIKGKEVGKGITLPLGGLRLSEYAGGSLSKAQTFARKQLKTAKLLSKGEGRTFYAVGGT
ncbi:hypothetical protein ACC870_38270, partial [Rhizobium ruizarguesonis]